MSETPAEIAEREAAEAEREDDGATPDDDEGQGSSEAVPEQDDGAEAIATVAGPSTRNVTPEEWERRFQKAERRFDTYQKAIVALWEDDAIHLTPIGVGASAPPGFIDVREAGMVPPEVQQPVLEFYGFTREQSYEPDPQTQECRTCKGKGKTATGSKVPGKETRACPTCKGSGAEGLDLAPNAAQGNGHEPEAFSIAQPTSTLAPDDDPWGQPLILPDGRENPNHGKMPQYWVQVEPWGDTRRAVAPEAG